MFEVAVLGLLAAAREGSTGAHQREMYVRKSARDLASSGDEVQHPLFGNHPANLHDEHVIFGDSEAMTELETGIVLLRHPAKIHPVVNSQSTTLGEGEAKLVVALAEIAHCNQRRNRVDDDSRHEAFPHWCPTHKIHRTRLVVGEKEA